VKTEDLIVQLAAAAGPVKRLPRPASRLATWAVVAVIATAAGVSFFGLRSDLATTFAAPEFLLGLGLTISLAIAAAGAALTLSVPGLEHSPAARWLPLAAGGAWIGALGVALASSGDAMARLAAMPIHQLCVVQIAVLAVVPAWLALVQLQRAAPLRRHWSVGLAALAALGLGAAGTQLLCPLNDPAHLLTGHAMPVAILALGAAAAGPLALRRRHHR
jgi:hypothetical protein